MIKLILISIGIIGETYTGFRGGRFVNLGNGHHITMFSFFLFNALVDLVYFYRPRMLPENLDYMTAIFGFCIEGFLFSWHLHGRSDIDIQVHTFLYYAVVVTVAFGFLEIFNKDKVIFALGRSGATFLQGTWFWQIGFIIHNPTGENYANTHQNMMIVTMMFAWHIAFAMIVATIIGCFVYLGAKKRYPDVVSNMRLVGTGIYEDNSSDEETLLETNQSKEYSSLPTTETV